jgi:GT2 family glycosyltransferase
MEKEWSGEKKAYSQKLFVLIRKTVKAKEVNAPEKWNDYVLQGCSYFLTPEFFKKYNKLYPKTFLYWEEINLLYYLYKANLKTLLIKTEPLIHKDKGTTNLITSNLSKFQLKHSFKSMLKSIPLFFMDYETIVKKF